MKCIFISRYSFIFYSLIPIIYKPCLLIVHLLKFLFYYLSVLGSCTIFLLSLFSFKSDVFRDYGVLRLP